MDKLPRKEDLLSAQHKDNPAIIPTETSKESLDVKKSKDAADIAKNRADQVEYETKIKLTERDYKSIEQGIADVAKKLQEADKRLENAHQQELSIADSAEKVEQEKQKAIGAFKIVKEREASVNARLGEAVKIENNQKEIFAKTETLRREILGLINYHNAYISPIIKVLHRCVSAIDDVRLVLRYPDKYDKQSLLYYIQRKGNLIRDYADKLDSYLDTIPEVIKRK